MLAWKHGIAVLTAGDVKVTSNPRIRLMPPQQGIIDTSARSSQSNSYNLEIQNVRMTDAGDYACQIGSIVPKEIVHSLEVLGKCVCVRVCLFATSARFARSLFCRAEQEINEHFELKWFCRYSATENRLCRTINPC